MFLQLTPPKLTPRVSRICAETDVLQRWRCYVRFGEGCSSGSWTAKYTRDVDEEVRDRVRALANTEAFQQSRRERKKSRCGLLI